MRHAGAVLGPPQQPWPDAVARAVLSQLPVPRADRGARQAEIDKVVRTADGAVVILVGSWAVKLHEPGSDGARVGGRLRIAAHPAVRAVLLAPALTRPLPVSDPDRPGAIRWASLWPRAQVLDPAEHDHEDAEQLLPWAALGSRLAVLHRIPVTSFGAHPPHGAQLRVRRALDQLAAWQAAPGPRPPGADPDLAAAAVAVLAAGAGLPPVATVPHAPGRPFTLVHGDWHLGQLARRPGPGGEAAWLLLDVDDLGFGDPIWDLARAAGAWAAGLLAPASWHGLAAGYLEAGGPALTGQDPYPVLDAVARAAVVQSAAVGLLRAARTGGSLDEVDHLLVAACVRMIRPPGWEPVAGAVSR